MKNYVILFMISAGVLFSCTPKQPSVPGGEYLIQGKLKHLPDSLLVQLFEHEGKGLVCVQVDTVINGEFTFRDTASVARIVEITLSRNKGFPRASLPVWVASGKCIGVTGENKRIRTWQLESSIPEQQEENRYAAYVRTEEEELMDHMAVEGELSRLMRECRDDHEFFEEMKVKRDSVRKLIDAVCDIRDGKTVGYMKTVPVTSLWMGKLLHHAEFVKYDKASEGDLKALYGRMSGAQQQTETGKLIYSYLNPESTVGIGDEMADGNLYDLDGKLRRLSEFKGKYILLDFWGSSCAPCIASILEMEEIITMYKEKIAVVGISEDPENVWRKCVAEKKMGGYQWNELRNGNTGIAARYRVNAIPYYVLITPDGKIQDMWRGSQGPLKERIKENLKK